MLIVIFFFSVVLGSSRTRSSLSDMNNNSNNSNNNNTQQINNPRRAARPLTPSRGNFSNTNHTPPTSSPSPQPGSISSGSSVNVNGSGSSGAVPNSNPSVGGGVLLSTQTQLASLRGALEAARLREEKHKAEQEKLVKELDALRWEHANSRRGEVEVGFLSLIHRLLGGFGSISISILILPRFIYLFCAVPFKCELPALGFVAPFAGCEMLLAPSYFTAFSLYLFTSGLLLRFPPSSSIFLPRYQRV